jgi:L-asparaginase II
MQFKPFKVEALRGTKVESRHIVHAVILGRNSRTSEIFGDQDFPVFPRSSLKPIQALPLVLTGAADHFQVTEAELALACASHRGELIHVNPVRAWLNRLGLNESYLECGTHAPSNQDSFVSLIQTQQLPSSIHNNCSGKHTGMLATALHLNEPTKNYVSFNHPVQQRITHYTEKLCGIKLPPESFGIDGCSIPAPCLPLTKLAQGFLEFIDPSHLSDSESQACQRLFSAFVKHPLLTSGTGHYCSDLIAETKSRVLIKDGAEGVMVAAIPELKLAMALKAQDGNSRATELCTSLILERLGLLSKSSPFLTPKIHNWNQMETGHLSISNRSVGAII